jgi:hypothetical protein
MKRRVLAVSLGSALFVLAIGSIAQGTRHNTSIFANSSGGSTSTSVYGSLTSPFDNCKKRRVVTVAYTSTTGQAVTATDKTDVTGGFRVPADPVNPTPLPPAGGPITVSVSKKRVRPFKEDGESVKHICKKKSVTATPLAF